MRITHPPHPLVGQTYEVVGVRREGGETYCDVLLAVHSLKDLPTKLPEDLLIGAVMEREDPVDALISPSGRKLAQLPRSCVMPTREPVSVRVAGAPNALTDAFVTAQVLQRQLRALPDYGVRTLGDMLRVGNP